MANAVQDIGDIVKKCKILLLDIEGTTTSISFVKDKLFPYAEENVQKFLEGNWETDDVKEAVVGLRKLSVEDQAAGTDGVVTVLAEDASKEDQIEGLVKSVKWLMGADRKVAPLKLLQGLIWKQGYDNGDIKGHVYDDVSPALELWRSVEGQKVYIYSSGSVQAQKLLFGQSLAGDLLKQIDGHFDTAVGAKQEGGSYTKIVEEIGCNSDDVLFLTDIIQEAEAARSAGVKAALVSREGNAPLPSSHTFPVINSLAQLTVSNKRKPDEAQEEQPAKVPKTDVEDDVKTASEAVKEVVDEKTTVETEKMEVEDATPALSETLSEQKDVKGSTPSETKAEDITDVPELTNDVPVTETKPETVEVNEIPKKTEEKQTDEMETETSEPIITKPDDEKSDVTAPVAEETPPITITEIEDVTDKNALGDVAEIIENLEPVVEEPDTAAEIEELQNVGEVLEKECDEILSKVQDVTNLENIPIKPLLNTIAEETMETENTDSNDIVDRILDTELELEMKQCADIDPNTVAEITEDNKKEQVEGNGQLEQTKETESKDMSEASPVENGKSEEKPEESKPDTKPVETNVEDKKTKNNESQTAPKESTDKEEGNVNNAESSDKKEEAKPETDKKEENSEKEEAPVPERKEEPEMNGKTNGTKTLNGDASEELSARLSVENGKEVDNGKAVVNGSNGDAVEENGNSDSKAEEVEIKVKAVATDEMRDDPPIQQTAEA